MTEEGGAQALASEAASTRATPPLVAPAAYDPVAEVARLTREARAALGERAVVQVVGELYVLAAPAPGPSFDQEVKLLGDALPAFVNGRFTRGPDRALTVFLLPSQASYRAFATGRRGAPAPLPEFGFFARREREIVINVAEGIHTLTHEVVHAFVLRDFPAAPAWFDEGLGALFENPVIDGPGEIRGETNWRLPILLGALRAGRADGGGGVAQVGLEALFGMSEEAFWANELPEGEARKARVRLHYAMARYACQWLQDKGVLWRFYRGWREGVAGDAGGERAFRAVVGEGPGEANGEWVAWVKGLGAGR